MRNEQPVTVLPPLSIGVPSFDAVTPVAALAVAMLAVDWLPVDWLPVDGLPVDWLPVDGLPVAVLSVTGLLVAGEPVTALLWNGSAEGVFTIDLEIDGCVGSIPFAMFGVVFAGEAVFTAAPSGFAKQAGASRSRWVSKLPCSRPNS